MTDDKRDAAERFAANAEEAADTARHRALMKVAASAKALADPRNWDAEAVALKRRATMHAVDDEGRK